MCPEDYQAWLKTQHFHPAIKDRTFQIGELAMAGSIAADLKTTSTAIGNHWVEKNPIIIAAFGNRPTNKELVAGGLIEFGLDSGLNYLSYRLGQKDPSKFWRVGSKLSVPIIVSAAHLFAAGHNISCCSSPWQPPLGGTVTYQWTHSPSR